MYSNRTMTREIDVSIKEVSEGNHILVLLRLCLLVFFLNVLKYNFMSKKN